MMLPSQPKLGNGLSPRSGSPRGSNGMQSVVLLTLAVLLLMSLTTLIPWARTAASSARQLKMRESLGPGADEYPGPYKIPRLIHQTVPNKNNLSCQHLRVINSWKQLNPGYQYQLWDDKDQEQMISKHYPNILQLYKSLLSGAERADVWRLLVLHQHGGVYADSDVECLQPIDKWNAEFGHDAHVLVGWENAEGEINNWVMAAAPGHSLLGSMPEVITAAIARQFLIAAKQHATIDRRFYEQGLMERTGPTMWTRAVKAYLAAKGANISSISKDNINSGLTLKAGGVRVMPMVHFSQGWEVAMARQKQRNFTCADIKAKSPQAYTCHHFWGTWKSTYYFPQTFTYPPNC